VKGRIRPIRIFVLADALNYDGARIASLRPLHTQFLRAYRAQNWDESEALIVQCRKAGGEALNRYYGLFSARIKDLCIRSLGPNWDGVYAITEK
jgi:hypothetical protein